MNQKNFYEAFRDNAPLVFQMIRDIPYQVGLSDKAQIDHLLKSDFSSDEIAESIQHAGCSEKNLMLGSYLDNLYLNTSGDISFNLYYVVTKFLWADVISRSNWQLFSASSKITVKEIIEYLVNIIPSSWKRYGGSWQDEVQSILSKDRLNGEFIDLYTLVCLTFPAYHYSLSLNIDDIYYPLDASWDKDLERYGFSVDKGIGVQPIPGETAYLFNSYTYALNFKKKNPIIPNLEFPDINLIFYVAFNIALQKIRNSNNETN